MNESSSIDQLSPQRLARLLDVESAPAWQPTDAAAALRHQLAAPLLPDLAGVDETQRDRLKALLPSGAGDAITFEQLFLMASPPLPILEAVKHWARQLRGDKSSPLFEGPATVLYYAAIAAALVHLRQKISTLPADQLREGFCWASEQRGAESLRRLFAMALRQTQ